MNSYLIMDDKKTIESFNQFSSYATEQKQKVVKNIEEEQEKNIRSTFRSYIRLIFSRDTISRINQHIEPEYRVIAWIIIVIVLLMVVYQIISRSISFAVNGVFNLIFYIIYYILYIPVWIIHLIINILRTLLGLKKNNSTT